MKPYEVVKCLTVWQPWAWAIVAGYKDVENRSWPTPYRGHLLIHAGKNRSDMADWTLCDANRRVELVVPRDIAFGAVVGVVTLVDCTRDRKSAWHQHGQWGWYFEFPVAFAEAVPMRGQQGLFDVACPEELPDEWPMWVE